MHDGAEWRDPDMTDKPSPRGLAAREAALGLLSRVLEDGRPLDEALEHALAPGGRMAPLAERDRAFARLLAATVLRRLGQIDDLLARAMDRPIDARSARIREILRLGVAQLLFLDTPPHAAIDSAVRLASRKARFKGLVNAVLRRLSRDGAAWRDGQDAARLNTPDWLWRSWVAAHGGAAARAMAEVCLQEPGLDIAVKGAPEDWAGPLGAQVLPTGALRRAHAGGITGLAGYAEGAWWVQDAAAALPARLLGDVAGRAVLDLCAAPGGKTAQLAALGARVTAVDVSEPRLERLRDNLARLHLSAETVAASIVDWRPQAPAELILLDAPCTATGTIRRHPDIWRRRKPADVAVAARRQEALLAAAVEMLAPAGRLVYCVCSLQPEEGPERIAALLAAGAPVTREPIEADELFGRAEWLSAEGDLRTLPHQMGGIDGFYACRLRRAQ